MEEIINISLPWILLSISSVFALVLIVSVCVCWHTKKYKNKKSSYALESGNIRSQLASNNIPHIITGNKPKYFSHNSVSYSSINQSDAFSTEMVPRGSFSFGIFNLFRHIQSNKCKDDANDLTKVFTEGLEESNTELMIKKFDKSILCLNWNDNSDNESNDAYVRIDNDEAYSCISNDSKTTFKSAVPHYNRSHSIADTFKSVNSEN